MLFRSITERYREKTIDIVTPNFDIYDTELIDKTIATIRRAKKQIELLDRIIALSLEYSDGIPKNKLKADDSIEKGIQLGEARGIQLGEARGIQLGRTETARNLLRMGLDLTSRFCAMARSGCAFRVSEIASISAGAVSIVSIPTARASSRSAWMRSDAGSA